MMRGGVEVMKEEGNPSVHSSVGLSLRLTGEAISCSRFGEFHSHRGNQTSRDYSNHVKIASNIMKAIKHDSCSARSSSHRYRFIRCPSSSAEV